MSWTPAVVERLRRPEYTGRNRCVPCTAANLVIAGFAAAVVALLGPRAFAPLVGGAVFVVAAALVYLRGYLVPGTPWFTRTYFPDWLLRRFDESHASPRESSGEVDVEGVLVDADVLADCEDEDDLCLAPDFGADWRGRIEALRREDTSREDLADVLGVPVEQLSFSEHGDALMAFHYSEPVGQWESRAAFLADVTAAGALAGRVPGWERLDVDERGTVLAGLRLFVERCPSCDGDVTVGEEVTTSCCRSFDVVAATCAGCGARLFEAELAEAA